VDGYVLIGLVVLGIAVATPVAAFLALSRTRRMRDDLEALRQEVIRLRADGRTSPPSSGDPGASRPGERPASAGAAAAGRTPPPIRIPLPPPQPANDPEPAATASPVAPRVGSGAESGSDREAAPTDEPGDAPPPQPQTRPAAARTSATPGAASRKDDWGSASDRFEHMVAANWLVWLGAAALGLGGIFLVRYAWEQGYFGPTARTLAALVAGLAMVGAGEWMRRRVRPDAPGQLPRAPLAVTAAGVLTLYAAVYAAGPRYGLVSPPAALASFVLVSALAVGLALIHGALLAVLGFVGGYIAPILVGGDAPAPFLVLGYALAVTAAALFLVRALNWRSMVWVGLAGATLWAVIGLGWLASPTGPVALSVYLCALVLLATLLAWPMASEPPSARLLDMDRAGHPASLRLPLDGTVLATYGYWALAALVAFVGLQEAPMRSADALLAACALMVAGGVLAGSRRPGFLFLPLVSLLLAIAVAAVLSVAGSNSAIPPAGPFLQRLADPGDQLYRFALFTGGSAVVLGGGGWITMRHARRKSILALVSAFGPLLLLAIAFLRLDGAGAPPPWGLAAAFLAALNLAALEGLHRSRVGLDAHPVAASAYALAAFAASMLAVTVVLPPVWMTALFAAHLPAIAVLDRRFNLPALRLAATLAGMATLARLVWPDQLLAYDIARTPVWNELLILFGVPILCFWGAARIFGRSLKSGDGPLVQGLDVAAMTLFAAFVSTEIRHLATRGDLAAGFQGVAEIGAYATAWAGLALGMAARLGPSPRRWLRVLERIVFGVALALAVLGLGIIANPLISELAQPWALNGPPLLNLLAPSYLAPAVLIAGLAWLHHRALRIWSGHAAGFTSLGLLLLYVTLEVRNAFHVDLSLATGGPVVEAETYAYSIAWLAVAILTLLVGMATRRVAIRHAAMAILALAVVKVFVFDMASLDGVLRAVSFLGLGVALIAIAFLYQRVVLKPRAGA
jgi:uncharacterized membrane protein